MQGIDPGWKVPEELEGKELPTASPVDELRDAIHRAHSGLLADGGI
jgi:cytochrome c-type protein NapC